MQEKYGFIYIWFDKKHRRFYVGKHWGNENDGYICSSKWMKNSYKRRPTDFKRRILQRVETRDILAETEWKWGLLIKPEELGKRYYNLRLPGGRQWHDSPTTFMTVVERIKHGLANMTPEAKVAMREKISAKKRGKPTWIKGKTHTDASKKLLRQAKLNVPNTPACKTKQKKWIDANKDLISERTKAAMQDPAVKEKCRAPHVGRKHSPEEIANRQTSITKSFQNKTIASISEDDFRKIVEETRSSVGQIAVLMQKTALTRKQIEFLVSFYGLNTKKLPPKRPRWFNNGSKQIYTMSKPDNSWVEGKLK